MQEECSRHCRDQEGCGTQGREPKCGDQGGCVHKRLWKEHLLGSNPKGRLGAKAQTLPSCAEWGSTGASTQEERRTKNHRNL